MSGKKKKKKSFGVWMFLCGVIFTVLMGKYAYESEINGYNYHNPLLLWASIFFAIPTVILGILYMNDTPDPPPPEPHKPPKPPKPQIVRTKLMAVNGVNGTYRKGTVSGALMGGMLGGGLGALIGAAANTQDRQYNIDNKYTFLVIYDDDTQKLETVSERHDKKRFDLLVSKLETE